MTDQAVATPTAMAPGARRPREGDDAVVQAAATSFAAEAAVKAKAILDGITAEEFKESVLQVLPVLDYDGMELAKAMNRRHGYDLDMELVELMAGWSGHVRQACETRVRAWVVGTGPERPFEDVAKVTFKDHRGVKAGVAYASPRYDALAQCLVVPDGETRFLLDGAFAGGHVIAWEDLTVTGPADEIDRKRYASSIQAEARSKSDSEIQAFSHERRKSFESAVDAAVEKTRGRSRAELKTSLSDGLRLLTDDVGTPGFTAASPLAAHVTATLEALRRLEADVAFALDDASRDPRSRASR